MRLVEMAGVEPASVVLLPGKSTSLVDALIITPTSHTDRVAGTIPSYIFAWLSAETVCQAILLVESQDPLRRLRGWNLALIKRRVRTRESRQLCVLSGEFNEANQISSTCISRISDHVEACHPHIIIISSLQGLSANFAGCKTTRIGVASR